MPNTKFESYFQENLAHWYAGGPSPAGWTRTGPLILQYFDVQLAKLRHDDVGVDEAMQKNAAEMERWHLAFLSDQLSPRPRTGIEGTMYWKEYLAPRYNRRDAYNRVHSFLELFHNMKENGYSRKRPVWVADVRPLEMGFQWFRFDGAHRLACAKMLGMRTVPACLFDVEIITREDAGIV